MKTNFRESTKGTTPLTKMSIGDVFRLPGFNYYYMITNMSMSGEVSTLRFEPEKMDQNPLFATFKSGDNTHAYLIPRDQVTLTIEN